MLMKLNGEGDYAAICGNMEDKQRGLWAPMMLLHLCLGNYLSTADSYPAARENSINIPT